MTSSANSFFLAYLKIPRSNRFMPSWTCQQFSFFCLLECARSIGQKFIQRLKDIGGKVELLRRVYWFVSYVLPSVRPAVTKTSQLKCADLISLPKLNLGSRFRFLHSNQIGGETGRNEFMYRTRRLFLRLSKLITHLMDGCRNVLCLYWHFVSVWYTPGKIRVEHFTIFPSKSISKGAVDIKFSSDVGNKPSNPDMQMSKCHRCP